MFQNCDFNYNFYIDGFQNGGYIHRKQDSNPAVNLANENYIPCNFQ